MIASSVYIGDLRSRIGSRRDIHLVVPGTSFSSILAHVVDDITCDLTLENVSQGIVVHGRLQGNYSAQCSYGLIEFTEPLTITVNELFEDSKKIERDDEKDEETYLFTGDELDLEQFIRDAILLNLPLAPVCGHGPENCAVCSSQIVPFLAKDLDDVSNKIIGGIDDAIAETGQPKKDPRWSALDDFPGE